MSSRGRVIASVVSGVVMTIVAGGALVLLAGLWFINSMVSSLLHPPPVDDTPPPQLEAQHRAVAAALDAAAFVPGRYALISGDHCVVAGRTAMPICSWSGTVQLPSGDAGAFRSHLEAQGWFDNRQVGVGEAGTVSFARLDGDMLVCLTGMATPATIDVRASVSSCADHRPGEVSRWGGWSPLVPAAVPALLRLRGHDTWVPGADGAASATVTLRFRNRTNAPVSALEVRMRRAGTGRAEDCFADPLAGVLPAGTACAPVRTTPAGHTLYRSAGDVRGGLVRRVWFTVIGTTVVEIEPVDAAPTRPTLTDAELDAMVDSLRPASYDEITDAYAAEIGVLPSAAYWDEPAANR
jgi:hypothetical protein